MDGVAGATALPPRILNMTVPQVGHLPFIALRPFFMTSSTPSAISFLALHLTQYPSAINILGRLRRTMRPAVHCSVGMMDDNVNLESRNPAKPGPLNH